MKLTKKYTKLLIVYGDKLKRVYPTPNTKDFLWFSGIKYAVVDVKEQTVLFLNKDGEIVYQVAKNSEIDQPGMRFKLEYYAKHILNY
jgi:hypothetical protein